MSGLKVVVGERVTGWESDVSSSYGPVWFDDFGKAYHVRRVDGQFVVDQHDPDTGERLSVGSLDLSGVDVGAFVFNFGEWEVSVGGHVGSGVMVVLLSGANAQGASRTGERVMVSFKVENGVLFQQDSVFMGVHPWTENQQEGFFVPAVVFLVGRELRLLTQDSGPLGRYNGFLCVTVGGSGKFVGRRFLDSTEGGVYWSTEYNSDRTILRGGDAFIAQVAYNNGSVSVYKVDAFAVSSENVTVETVVDPSIDSSSGVDLCFDPDGNLVLSWLGDVDGVSFAHFVTLDSETLARVGSVVHELGFEATRSSGKWFQRAFGDEVPAEVPCIGFASIGRSGQAFRGFVFKDGRLAVTPEGDGGDGKYWAFTHTGVAYSRDGYLADWDNLRRLENVAFTRVFAPIPPDPTARLGWQAKQGFFS